MRVYVTANILLNSSAGLTSRQVVEGNLSATFDYDCLVAIRREEVNQKDFE